jgi:hypothetical protein
VSASFPDLRTAARLLGGEVSGAEILCPGPGHKPIDRSLSVKPDPSAPGGYVVHSFAGDDPIVCRDHVGTKVGHAPWQPNGSAEHRPKHRGERQAKRRAEPVKRSPEKGRTYVEAYGRWYIARFGASWYFVEVVSRDAELHMRPALMAWRSPKIGARVPS